MLRSPARVLRGFWRRRTDFDGFAAPGEFWSTVLLLALVGIALSAAATVVFGLSLGVMLGASASFGGDAWTEAFVNSGRIAIVVVLLFGVVALLPSAALLVRRLRDADLSGWLALLWFVPVLGVLVVLALALLPTGAGAGDDED